MGADAFFGRSHDFPAHAPLGIGPPIVRQRRPCVWVIVRRQTTRAGHLADHNRMIATVVPAIGCAFEPGERAINEWCAADGAWGVLDMVELAQEVASTI